MEPGERQPFGKLRTGWKIAAESGQKEDTGQKKFKGKA